MVERGEDEFVSLQLVFKDQFASLIPPKIFQLLWVWDWFFGSICKLIWFMWLIDNIISFSTKRYTINSWFKHIKAVNLKVIVLPLGHKGSCTLWRLFRELAQAFCCRNLTFPMFTICFKMVSNILTYDWKKFKVGAKMREPKTVALYI